MLAHHYLNALEYAKAAGRVDARLGRSCAPRAAGRGRPCARPCLLCRRRPLLQRCARAVARERSGSGVAPCPRRPRQPRGRRERNRVARAGFRGARSRGDADGAAEVAVELARRSWLAGERDAAYAWIDSALELAKRRGHSRARAYALVERAAYHLSASEHPAGNPSRARGPAAHRSARDGRFAGPGARRPRHVPRGERRRRWSRRLEASDRARPRAQCLLSAHRRRAQLGVIPVLPRAPGRRLGRPEWVPARRRALWVCRSAEVGAGRRGLRGVLHGRWDEAALMLDELVAEAEAGAAHYQEPAWCAPPGLIELARGELEGATAGSQKALERAREKKDAQVLAPALAFRGIAANPRRAGVKRRRSSHPSCSGADQCWCPHSRPCIPRRR